MDPEDLTNQGNPAQVDAPIAEPVPNVAEPAAVPTPPSPYREVAQKLGLDTDNIEDIASHWGRVQGDLETKSKALSEYEGRMKGMSPFLLAVQDELSKEGFQGTDAEIMQRLHGKLSKAQ